MDSDLIQSSDPTSTVDGSATQRTYRTIRRRIVTGEVRPGEKLKIEGLRLRLDTGASPIREALSEMDALPRNTMGKVKKASCAKASLRTRKARFYVSVTGCPISKDCAAASARRCAATPSSIDGFGAVPVAIASIKASISAI